MLRRRFVIMIALLAVLLGSSVPAAASSTTASDTATYSYDASDAARVDTAAIGHIGAASAQLSGQRARSASLFVEASRTCTTLAARSVAAEAATVRHYTTSEFAESISKGGEITPGLSSGKTWLTPDEYLNGVTAQSRLALNKTPDGYFEIPMCRVSCPSSPSRVQPYNGQPGGGIEITTNSPIDVSGLPFTPFGPR
jgi:hypothetical protein